MTVISMRTLSRETARVIAELTEVQGEAIITLDGVPVAHLTAMSPVEQAMYAELVARGVDPHNPPPVNPELKMLPPVAPGEKSASDYLMEERDSYYAEQ